MMLFVAPGQHGEGIPGSPLALTALGGLAASWQDVAFKSSMSDTKPRFSWIFPDLDDFLG